MEIQFNANSFASGQIGSKIWLCEELEKVCESEKLKNPVIWVLGGWVGALSLLLFSRNKISNPVIRSFDLNPENQDIAEKINDLWYWKDARFRAYTKDCNTLNYLDSTGFGTPPPDIIINTSSEHFDNLQWWENIPKGTISVIQCTNMENEDHKLKVFSAEELENRHPCSQVYFSGELGFDYGNETSFKRFMLIGRR